MSLTPSSLTPSLLTLPQWSDFEDIARPSLISISQAHPPSQWLIAETHGDGVRILLCSGDGPLREGAMLPAPQGSQPILLGGGTAIWVPLDDRCLEKPTSGYLGVWMSGPPQKNDATLLLMRSKASLFDALLNQLQLTQKLLGQLAQAQLDAETDSLTGLLNRRGWNNQLVREQARCQRYDHTCTILAIDLDNLKRINDIQGHCAGDRLIRRIGTVLAETTRQPDIVARIGGDEFAVLLVNTDSLQARSFEQRLATALNTVKIDASVGKASLRPGESLQDTLCRADHSMYANKASRTPRLGRP
ncbi:MAG: hypothetical protein CVV10_00230 [Gammaproteobacteria bacterium HGW-Gammaproteobacteria-14]|nr:MAG: hypothetical protein CVV10_00230 [Gammaproteobacteria bacterium HGW-Gammaproteobacteria-14]